MHSKKAARLDLHLVHRILNSIVYGGAERCMREWFQLADTCDPKAYLDTLIFQDGGEFNYHEDHY
jgi:hypothetical protein